MMVRNPGLDDARMMARETSSETLKALPPTGAQFGTYEKEFDFSKLVKITTVKEIVAAGEEDDRQTNETIAESMLQCKERKAERVKKIAIAKEEEQLALVMKQESILKEVRSYVMDTRKREHLLNVIANWASRNPNNMKWRGLAKQLLESFDVDEATLDVFTRDIVEKFKRAARN